MLGKQIEIKRHLFNETSHSPSLIDIVGEEQLGDVVDFCFIENPYFPDEKLLQKLQDKLPEVIKAYPSSNPKLAQQDLAAVVHVKPEYLVLGNGATELITIIQNNFLEDMGIPIPTFSEYIEKVQNLEKVKLFQLPADKQYQLDLDEYADWLENEKLSSALIINPGNPTGQLISIEDITGFFNRMKHLKLVLVDESFIDFAGEEIPSLMPMVEQFHNLIIVRSMSKHCGVPGLRLGYCCTANQEYLKQIRNALPVWNINTLAEYFLTQLKDTDVEYHNARKHVISDVRELHEALCKIDGYEVYPSNSNFILLKVKFAMSAYDLQMKLLQDFGVYVRDCSNKIGLDDKHIRIASKGRDKDQLLIHALKEVAAEF
ncbi:histidinol-phosphate transaminase [uncultured Draconibacterium sp.]|uniref:pyridoxal phosphate-dependent aminotransferase n=1 Tax=uncultured Draconibacterium sp. TaxID=1573823 RepID=UPI0025D8E8DF|nr:histidinol-phosphate transaminase [uncultured Draconibacterium sp.]